jgi:predicted nucleotidyltransferase component of viral defense system
MDSNRELRIDQSEALHQKVMQQVLARIQDTPYVLKGGTALLFTRKLDRHSTDLDFDAGKQINIEGRIREGLKAAGVEVKSISKVKDTATVQRYKIHYLDPVNGKDRLLKIETSFRQEPKVENIEVVNGIRTYAAGYMFDLKMDAAENRTQARDLYDLAHLLREYGDQLSSVQIARAEVFSQDIGSLVTRYSQSFNTDNVLKTRANIDDTVIALREAVEVQQRRNSDSPLSKFTPQDTTLPEQPDPNMVSQTCLKCLEVAGQTTERGLRFEGNRYIINGQDKDISITAKDGRGVIFEVKRGKVNSKMLTEDISSIQALNQHIEAIGERRPENFQQSQAKDDLTNQKQRGHRR